jgi:urease accessory protein
LSALVSQPVAAGTPARGGATAALLLLADGRLPTGAHVHSGGVEEAVTDGRITGLKDLRRYLDGRLWTTGAVDAALAVASCTLAPSDEGCTSPHGVEFRRRPRPRSGSGGAGGTLAARSRLDAEAAARVPSPALRRASRTQGRGLLRAARRLWPAGWLDELVSLHPEGPMWAPTLGAVARAAGVEVGGAALVAAQGAVSGPAWAAVRLLGLDPFSAAALLADLAPAIDTVTARAVSQWTAGVELAQLPALGGPLTDVAAEAHASREVRLFAS